MSWILLLALAIRIYACLTNFIINPDGIHYIHQARSIFYGQWDKLTTCRLNYVSILPFCIASVFTFVRDWIVAGRVVTVFFGTATLIPLSFILRRFFDRTLSYLTLLLYALLPVWVNRSADIVRGPIFWFFLCLGMLYFIRQLDEDKHHEGYRLDLYLSSIFLLIAAWTRTEGLYAIIVSGIYILLADRGRKMSRFFHFSTPIALIILAGGIGFLFSDSLDPRYLRLDRIAHKLTQFIPIYQDIREQLKVLISNSDGRMAEFLHHVRSLVWFMPLSIIFNSIWEAFFYPYAVMYVIGFIGLRRHLREDRRIGYFLWLSGFSILVLYVHLLHVWLIFHRFLVILILPGCIMVGFGIEHILKYLQQKFRLSTQNAVKIMAVLIVLFGLSKGLIPRETDKAVFAQAGRLIAQQKRPDRISPIMAACSTVYEWVFFYAHLEYPGAQCAADRCNSIPADYQHMVADLKASGTQFVLYEEKKWPRETFDLKQAPYKADFDVLGRWRHRDTGELILLRLKQPESLLKAFQGQHHHPPGGHDP